MRRVLVAGMAAVTMLVGASVARADHTHVLILPNGKCAILAAAGNEKYLILPSVLFNNNPNVDADDAAGGLEGLHAQPPASAARVGAPRCSRRRRGNRGDGFGPGSVCGYRGLRERLTASPEPGRGPQGRGPSSYGTTANDERRVRALAA